MLAGKPEKTRENPMDSDCFKALINNRYILQRDESKFKEEKCDRLNTNIF